ncbi:MAG TPA: Gfo/Idh/MocA family oxidoreductase, partial [Candidatus Hydrogenedentes bacterium]|nr:Gfo/Idh/MocA family oxidoreductase [Candidatus Hydrogenedentota bacterium]
MKLRGSKQTWSRRQFLRYAGVTAAGAVAAPTIITSKALGAVDRAAASERITMGVIGLGGRGRHVIEAFMANPDVQVIAVCDAIGDRRKAGKAQVDQKYGNKDCAEHIDCRELLARSDIDAVLVATGDNAHSPISILAARAGKDIYCEKPMSVALTESRAVSDT